MVKGTAEKAKIELVCEDCGKSRVVQRFTALLDKPEHPCRPCSNKRNGIAKRGKPSHNAGVLKPEHERKVGNTYINSHGYREVYVGPEEAARNGRQDSYVLEHRIIVRDMLGRDLLPGEVVHHIDGDKINNSPENLVVCSKSAHREIHNNLERIAFHLFSAGVIGYDKEREAYYIARPYSNVGDEPCEFRERLRPSQC